MSGLEYHHTVALSLVTRDPMIAIRCPGQVLYLGPALAGPGRCHSCVLESGPDGISDLATKGIGVQVILRVLSDDLIQYKFSDLPRNARLYSTWSSLMRGQGLEFRRHISDRTARMVRGECCIATRRLQIGLRTRVSCHAWAQVETIGIAPWG